MKRLFKGKLLGCVVYLISVVLLISIFCEVATAKEILRLSTTTSLYDSGLLQKLEPLFEKQYKVDLQIIPVGTGIALKYGQKGDVDVVLVHDRKREDAFIFGGYGVERRCIAYNFFLIVGPKDDPAGIKGLSPSEAFKKLYEQGTKNSQKVMFVSRGDDSGTHAREKSIWHSAGFNYNDIRNSGKWYIESGKGMGATLMLANEKQAYTLVDIGTFLAFSKKIDLVPLVEKGKELMNVYGVMAVNPRRYPHTNFKMAINFINFLMSDKIQKVIANFGKDKYGRPLFYPVAKQCKKIGCPTYKICQQPATTNILIIATDNPNEVKLIEEKRDLFEKKYNCHINLVKAKSKDMFVLGKKGIVDLIITNDQNIKKQLEKEGYGITDNTCTIKYNNDNYYAIAINPKKNKQVNYKLAEAFIEVLK